MTILCRGQYSEFAAYSVSSEYAADFSVDEAARTLLVPELPEVWDFLVNYLTLGEIAQLYRGIRMESHR